MDTCVLNGVSNQRGERRMLVRALTNGLLERTIGIVMVANRFLGNPTDRDDNGGLRNRVYAGAGLRSLGKLEGITTGPGTVHVRRISIQTTSTTTG